MILVKKLKFLLRRFFLEKDLDMMFNDVLNRNEGFIDYKNAKLLLSLFFIQKDLDLMFDDVLGRKEGFLDHKNVILTKQKNERFSSGVKS